MGFDRRQPSQDFGPIIGDRKVMTVIHVEDIGAVGKRDGITIPAAGSIENIAITILRVGSVDRNIMSSRTGIMEDLVTEVGYGGLFLTLDDPSPESERKVGFITAQLVKNWATPPELCQTNITPLATSNPCLLRKHLPVPRRIP